MEYGWKDFLSVYGGPKNASAPWKKYKKDHKAPKEFFGESKVEKKTTTKPKKSPPKSCPKGKVFNPEGTRCINEGGTAHLRYLKEGSYDDVITKKYALLLVKKRPGRPKGSGKKKSPKKSPRKVVCPEGKVLNPKGTGCINEGGVAHLRYLRAGEYNVTTTKKYASLLVKKKSGRPKGSGKKTTAKPKKSPRKECPEGKVFNPKGTGCINVGGAAHKRYLLEGAYDKATTDKYAHLLEKKAPGRPKGSGKKKSPKKSPRKECPEGKVFNPKGTGCILLGGDTHKKYLREGKYNKTTTAKYKYLLEKKKPGRPKGSGKKSPKKKIEYQDGDIETVGGKKKIFNGDSGRWIAYGGQAFVNRIREGGFSMLPKSEITKYKTKSARGRPKGSGKKKSPKRSPRKSPTRSRSPVGVRSVSPRRKRSRSPVVFRSASRKVSPRKSPRKVSPRSKSPRSKSPRRKLSPRSKSPVKVRSVSPRRKKSRSPVAFRSATRKVSPRRRSPLRKRSLSPRAKSPHVSKEDEDKVTQIAKLYGMDIENVTEVYSESNADILMTLIEIRDQVRGKTSDIQTANDIKKVMKTNVIQDFSDAKPGWFKWYGERVEGTPLSFKEAVYELSKIKKD